MGLIYANLMLGALKHLQKLRLGALNIYICPRWLIYANFMLGLGGLKHLLFTRVRSTRYLRFLPRVGLIYANFMLGLDRG